MSGASKSAIVHLGESEERCSTLCGTEPTDGDSNVDLDSVSWDAYGAWIEDVNCIDCLHAAIKIGEDATAQLERRNRDSQSRTEAT